MKNWFKTCRDRPDAVVFYVASGLSAGLMIADGNWIGVVWCVTAAVMHAFHQSARSQVARCLDSARDTLKLADENHSRAREVVDALLVRNLELERRLRIAEEEGGAHGPV